MREPELHTRRGLNPIWFNPVSICLSLWCIGTVSTCSPFLSLRWRLASWSPSLIILNCILECCVPIWCSCPGLSKHGEHGQLQRGGGTLQEGYTWLGSNNISIRLKNNAINTRSYAAVLQIRSILVRIRIQGLYKSYTMHLHQDYFCSFLNAYETRKGSSRYFNVLTAQYVSTLA
jgi:hypothetical protein